MQTARLLPFLAIEHTCNKIDVGATRYFFTTRVGGVPTEFRVTTAENNIVSLVQDDNTEVFNLLLFPFDLEGFVLAVAIWCEDIWQGNSVLFWQNLRLSLAVDICSWRNAWRGACASVVRDVGWDRVRDQC